jgi:hypothetical protein
MTSLPQDLTPHAESIAVTALAVALLLVGAIVTLWRTRERDKENSVAAALVGVGAEIKEFRTEFSETVREIFGEIKEVRADQREHLILCASRHANGPRAWNGEERRRAPHG